MQNKYVGDVKDFGKFGLLRCIAPIGCHIGVNWYLSATKPNKIDRRHIGYLVSPRFKGCDDALLQMLEAVVDSGERDVAQLELRTPLVGATYYQVPLPSPREVGTDYRSIWHENAKCALAGCDIIYLDTQHGLMMDDGPFDSVVSTKCVTEQELTEYYSAGKSVLFHQQRGRFGSESQMERIRLLSASDELSNAHLAGMTFRHSPLLDFIFVLQPKHAAEVEAAIDSFLQSRWQRHFSRLELSQQMNDDFLTELC